MTAARHATLLSLPTSVADADGRADVHVHSSFSDDARSSVADDVHAARRAGLAAVVFADHVRTTTTWVPELVSTVRQQRQRDGVRLYTGVEAKMLDLAGRLDLPAGVEGLNAILIADHQMPSTKGPVHPGAVVSSLDGGRSRPADVVEQLVEATAAGMRTVADMAITPVLAHLFSLLPKIGLAEGDVADGLLDDLVAVAVETGAVLDVNEKWACPSPRVVARFLAARTFVAPGSDSHLAADVGRCPTSLRTIAEARALLQPA